MSHYPLEDLMLRWKREDLTTEQMIGQILQLLHDHERRLHSIERAPRTTEPKATQHEPSTK